jgi:RNA polymerase sigma factor (TIGR02999 family)
MLQQAQTGDKQAADRLFGYVYNDLRKMAARLMASRARPWSGDEAASLVNAACERLLIGQKLNAQDRRHFFYLLSRAMQDVLVEQARSDLAVKRGGRHHRVPLGEFAAEPHSEAPDVLDLKEALEEFQKHDPEAAEVVMLRFFAGRSLDETSELMGCSVASVRRNWEYARAWLHERLSRGG